MCYCKDQLSQSLKRDLDQVGSHLGLVYSIQEILCIHSQGVGGRQHLALALLAQGGHGILLSQAHLVDQLRKVLVQKFLSTLDLPKGEI